MSNRKKSHKQHVPQIQPMTSVTSALPLYVLGAVTLIAVAVFLAYLPSINGGFIWDDHNLLTENKIIKAPDGLYRLWCTTEMPDYWPVTYSTFWMEWRLWGMNSTGYHVTNLILHIFESLLIWLILRKLSIPGAFLAAMIFAVHPVNVESIAWIAQRKNLMAMLFFLLSIYWYLKLEIPLSSPKNHLNQIPTSLDPRSSHLWYRLSLIAFAFAMLSKGSVAVLPVLLLMTVWWLRPLTRRDLIWTAPFFMVAAVLAGVNVWFQTHGGEAIRTAGFFERLLGAGAVVWFYLYKVLLPINLSFVYQQWHIEVNNPLWWLPLLAALITTAVLWRYRKTWSRPFLFAWMFFCVALLPVMGFTDVYFFKYALVADHYQHIALIGIITLAAAFWGIWHRRMQGTAHWAATIVAIAAVGALTSMTWKQSRLYYDEPTLYQDTLKKNPNCLMAHNNLGNILFFGGQLRDAIEHYRQALRITPDHPEAYYNLANCFKAMGQDQQAIVYYEQALRLKPSYTDAHNNLGNVFYKIGRLPEAIQHYRQALQLKPDYPEANNNLGLALSNIGRPQEAIKYYQQAIRLKSDYYDAYNNLGAALIQTDRNQEAIECLNQVLRISPDNIIALVNLSSAYAKMQQSSQAVAAAQKALEIARSQKQIELAKQIEDWLNNYQRTPKSGRETSKNSE